MPNKKKRLAIESAVILLTEIKQRSGKFQLSSIMIQLVIMEHNINKQLRLFKNKRYVVTRNNIT